MPQDAYSPMQIARLRRPLTIVSDTVAPTADGLTKSTTTVLATHGQVQAKMVNTLIAAITGQAMAQSQYVITLRYPPSITISPGMRVIDGRKSYRIHQVADLDERHRIMQLFCLEEPAV